MKTEAERTNRDRVEDVDRMFEQFRMWRENDSETNLSDLLGDLLHWSDAQKGRADFDRALERARAYHAEESLGFGLNYRR